MRGARLLAAAQHFLLPRAAHGPGALLQTAPPPHPTRHHQRPGRYRPSPFLSLKFTARPRSDLFAGGGGGGAGVGNGAGGPFGGLAALLGVARPQEVPHRRPRPGTADKQARRGAQGRRRGRFQVSRPETVAARSGLTRFLLVPSH